ncbi:hypothetical protein HYH03_000391 [Edaphochlamys debaryana]|uniref:EGF-like domain-containing protein n=1 Tax=Edaphochlamys debaryana TaxID=47281 RepID=A0A835YIK9_9CHLO|nr:hypothetical protein HYH03_000391 [Edaphochlamys debaryana]|eukprot:KAG2501893.1 hypothetical protein HYH03_000391 [Edaphochlamys debaryana]
MEVGEPKRVAPAASPDLAANITANATHGGSLSHASSADRGIEAEVHKRCAVSKGTWCGEYIRQTPVPSRPVPRGSKDCPNACSGWGTCDHDTGFCLCPAGRKGQDCGQEDPRPCTGHYRLHTDHAEKEPKSTVGPDGLDVDPLKPGWKAGRCYGYCDTSNAACYCGWGKYRHIPAPPGSPPWTPPVQQGRPLSDACQPKTNEEGKRSYMGSAGGGVPYEDVYGPQGWCNNQTANVGGCNCFLEVGHPCVPGAPALETMCLNQCSGHGECYSGYCRCHEGWYGADCSRKKAGSPMEPGMQEADRPWLNQVMQIPPAALESPPPTRRRPLIYVYDVPPAFTTRMLQYALVSTACKWRVWGGRNHSEPTAWTYSVETLLHELLLQSKHRTFDPEEADFFYVPFYVTCYFWPIMGWVDHPWWHAPNVEQRPYHGANMVTELHEWLTTQLPWWKRRGGRDHIFLTAADEGACWMPTAVYKNSIMLTHWGRMDPDHTSNTAYIPDNYTFEIQPYWKDWPGYDFNQRIAGHPCYDPKKDLVIPAFKWPGHYHQSPLLGAAPLERDILLFFKGDVGAHRLPHYSRGIRQKLFNLAVEHKWFDKHRIVIGTGEHVRGDYSQLLARSKFCLVAPGDGWSPRAEDAILHGCVPLIVMDEVHAVYESILDYDSFSIRIRESALEAVPDILNAVTPAHLAKMQRHLAKVWHRFAYASGLFLGTHIKGFIEMHDREEEGKPQAPFDHPYQRHTSFPFADDAFGTIMQWLYHRIPDTRGEGVVAVVPGGSEADAMGEAGVQAKGADGATGAKGREHSATDAQFDA